MEKLGIIGDVASGAIGALDWLTGTSSARQYKYTRKLQQHQMNFNKMMSDTAVQRRVADLKAAGLNPILAINGGGAADTAGAQGGSIGMQEPQQTNFAEKAIAAQEYKRIKEETKNLKSTTEQNESTTAKNYADIENNKEITKAQVNLLLKEAGYKQSEIEYYNKWGVFPGATTNTSGGLFGITGSRTQPVGLKNETIKTPNSAKTAESGRKIREWKVIH